MLTQLEGTAVIDLDEPAHQRMVEERRSDRRTPVSLSLDLRSLDGESVGRCTVENISEGGLRLRAALPCICVGERFELQIPVPVATTSRCCESVYATVVRTGPGAAPHEVVAGMRFDQPLLF